MAVSASQLQQNLQSLLPKNIEETRLVPLTKETGRSVGYDEIVGYGESGPIYAWRTTPEVVSDGYFSPHLNRKLTDEESKYIIPIIDNVYVGGGEGGGYAQQQVGSVFVGEKLAKVLNEANVSPQSMSAQFLPGGGLQFNPFPAMETDIGGSTNFAVRLYPDKSDISTYQSGTLFGNAKVDKIVDQLAKVANAGLLTYLGGQAIGAIGGDLFGAVAGDPTKAALYSNAGYGEGLLNMVPPPVISEPVLVPGDTALTGTLAQPPLAVENVAGQLTPEAQSLITSNLSQTLPITPPVVETPAGLLSPQAQKLVTQGLSQTLPITPPVVETPAGTLSPETANIINTTAVEGSMTPVTTGDPTKAALYSNEGYGPLSDQTVTGAPITSSPITSLGPAATLKDITDYLTGGAFAGSVTNALKEAFKAATGGGGLGGLGPIIGGLLSRAPTAAPSASVTPGRPVDITSPIQSLLAPKLVQQRPVTLL